MKKLIGWWLFLNFLSIPISYRLIPSSGQWLSSVLLPVNNWICSLLFKIDISNTYYLSDSAAFYATALILIPLFIGLCWVFIQLSKPLFSFPSVKINEETFLRTSLNYILAYFLLRYGFDKIIGEQFYFPASNTLFTPLGQLNKDILYWSTMGTSSFYNWFMASIEIICGILILIPRFRFIGLLFSVGVVLNILATNIGFDITVKFLSGLLVLTSIYLVSFYKSQLRMMFAANENKIIQSNEQNIKIENKTKRSQWISGIVMLIITLEILIPINFQQTDYTFESSSFSMNQNKSESKIFENVKRIHIHRDGYLITESNHQKFISYPIIKTKSGFKLKRINFEFNEFGSNMKWRENGALKEVILEKIDLRKLPISEDVSHWCLEELIFD